MENVTKFQMVVSQILLICKMDSAMIV